MSEPQPPPPIVIVSYSWDSEEHQTWVTQLARRLRANGIDAQLDRWNVTLGSDLNAFMERFDDPEARVIAVVSDAYAEKANTRSERSSGVGVETQILTTSTYENLGSNRVIPLIYGNTGKPAPNLPIYLKGRAYVSFQHDYEAAYLALLSDLHGRQVEAVPSLGPNPFAGQTDSQARVAVSTDSGRWTQSATSAALVVNLAENDGRFTIGSGDMTFGLFIQDLGGRSARHYRDYFGGNIGKVADVESRQTLLDDPSALPLSARYVETTPGDAVIMMNSNGYWAILMVDSLTQQEGLNEPETIMRSRYAIAADRSPNVSLANLTEIPDDSTPCM